VGANALRDNTTGAYNVAIGEAALANNTTGFQNMAIGAEALTNNNANFNLAIGFRVGFMNTTGDHLTGIGAAALRNNTTGSFNTAIGSDAQGEHYRRQQHGHYHNLTSPANTAIGFGALFNNRGVYQFSPQAATLPSAIKRSLATLIPAVTLPSVIKRSLAAVHPAATLPLGITRSITTGTITTRPSVFKRSSRIVMFSDQTPLATLPLGITRSLTTHPAKSTRRSVLGR
jgi:hypothetical protein